MATIKGFTSLEQSRKLAEILPLESANMWYHGHYSPWESERIYDEEPCPFHSKCPNWDNPCWSLDALLSVLPLPSLIQDKADDELFWQCSAYDKDGTLLCETYDYNNSIDACYKLILELHERKML